MSTLNSRTLFPEEPEIGRLLGRIPGITTRSINKLNSSMRFMISKTIESSMMLPLPEGKTVPYPPNPYSDFYNAIKNLRDNSEPKHVVSVLTFNYDLALDFTWFSRGERVDYGLDNEKSTDRMRYLKLHGSMNWFKCKKCKSISPWQLDEFFKTKSYHPHPLQSRSVILDVSSHIEEFVCPKCGGATWGPFLVPPTWHKSEGQREIAGVWRCAAEILSQAENVYIIGYSFPESDAFFHHLLALGTVGDTILRDFRVFDPDPTGEVEKRYRRILGPGASQKFRYERKDFRYAIQEIERTFRRR